VIQWELLIAAERKTRPRLAREHDPTGRHTRSFPSFLPSRREERRHTCVVVSNGEHGGRAEEAHRPVGRFDSNSTEPTHQKKRAIPCRPTPEAETATWIGWRGDSSGRNRRRQRVKSPSGERDAMQPASARLLASTSSPEKAAAAVGLWRAHCRCAAGRVVAGSLRPLFANPFFRSTYGLSSFSVQNTVRAQPRTIDGSLRYLCRRASATLVVSKDFSLVLVLIKSLFRGFKKIRRI
jgi:hypothetical protein